MTLRRSEVQSLYHAPKCESGEMVYSGDLKSPVARHTGSSPVSRTTHNGLLVKWDNSAMAWQHREFDSPTVHQLWVTLADSWRVQSAGWQVRFLYRPASFANKYSCGGNTPVSSWTDNPTNLTWTSWVDERSIAVSGVKCYP